jgi:hypothetical protein
VGFVSGDPRHINDLGRFRNAQSSQNTRNLSTRYKTGTAGFGGSGLLDLIRTSNPLASSSAGFQEHLHEGEQALKQIIDVNRLGDRYPDRNRSIKMLAAPASMRNAEWLRHVSFIGIVSSVISLPEMWLGWKACSLSNAGGHG